MRVQIKQRSVAFDREAPYCRSTQVRDYADTHATLATTTVAQLANRDVETLWGKDKPGAWPCPGGERAWSRTELFFERNNC